MSPKAEFTPRNVQTAEERSKLVYRIKVTRGQPRRHPEARHACRCGARACNERRSLIASRRSSSTRVVKRYGDDDGARRPEPRGEARRDVRPDRSRRRGQDDGDPSDVRSAASRRGRAARARPRSGARASRADRACRLSLAAIQPVWRSDHRREHRVLRRGAWRARLPRAPRSAAGDDAAHAVSRRVSPTGCPAA